MVVILSRGQTKWWLDARVVHACDACDTTYRLEATDEVEFHRGALKGAVLSRCPVCGSKVTTERPAVTRTVRAVVDAAEVV
jgi:DNA-directed RNA polymerase subunit RPC12/RpoP